MRIRTGSFPCEIEIGRWSGTPRCLRLCKLCGMDVEDEKHFLIDCKYYDSDMRRPIVECAADVSNYDGDLISWILDPKDMKFKWRFEYVRTYVNLRRKFYEQ